MPTVVLYRSSLKPDREFFDLPAGTDLQEWVKEQGLKGHIAVTLNGRPFDGGPLDLCVGDELMVVCHPADPATLTAFFFMTFELSWGVATFLTNAVYVVGLTLLSNAIFRPKSASARDNAARSVYNINAQGNVARPGAPIPVGYGDFVSTPDYASQPYVEYVNNEQYLNVLFCLGQGIYDVTELLAGDTSVDAGTTADWIRWEVFTPERHASTFGRIRSAMSDEFEENMVSSPEVGDQELLAPNQVTTVTGDHWYWKQTRTGGGAATGPNITGMTAAQTNAALRAALGSVPQLGDVVRAHTVETFINEETGVGGGIFITTNITFEVSPYVGGKIPALSVVPPGTTPVPTQDRWIGPFDLTKAGQHLDRVELDFVFSGGLFSMSSGGSFIARTVDVLVELEPVDDNGNNIGAVIPWNLTWTRQTNTPQRFTEKLAVPAGRYRVRARRTSNHDGKVNTVDRVTWAGAKAKVVDVNTPVYGFVTLVAARIRATNGVSGNALGRIRMRCRRLLRIWGQGDPMPTSNPVDVLNDILSAPYGGRRPLSASEIDEPVLQEARQHWANHNGFNGVFDRQITLWDALVLTLAPVGASPLPVGSLISIAQDRRKKNRVAVFSDLSVANLEVSYAFRKTGDPLGVRVEFRDPLTFNPAHVAARDPSEPENLADTDIFGCTSQAVAQAQADLAYYRMRRISGSVTFDTEMAGLTVRHGDRIGVQHSLPRWGQAAMVLEVNGTTLRVDTALDWTGAPLSAILRGPDGTVYEVAGVTRGADDNTMVFPSLPFQVVPFGATQEPTHIVIGTPQSLVTDWVVVSMDPVDETNMKISAVTYYDDDYDHGMPHQAIPL